MDDRIAPPSDSDLAARRARLSPAKRALIQQRLQGARTDLKDIEVIPRRPTDAACPLSFAQQRLWFLQQLKPDSSAYNDVMLLHFEGDLDVGALDRAIDEVVRRHDVLRSTFHGAGADLHQRVAAPGEPRPLPFVDLSALALSTREARLDEHVRDEAERPFDLATGPLVRTRLLKIDARRFVLVHAVHHIVSDGSSMQLFIQEAAELYRAFVQGRPSPLAELPLQYGDYAHWQRQWLTGRVLASQIEYWTRQLDGAPDRLDLAACCAPPAAPTGDAVVCEMDASPRLKSALDALCRQRGATLFMVLLAAFDALLYRYTGQQDVVVGTPVSGRTRPELETLIGFFVNTLPLRTAVTGDLTFVELLQRVRDAAFGAFAHQDLPFERIVEIVHPARAAGHAPLFDVMFALENFVEAGEQLPGLRTLDRRG
jgi:hypothetical protein